MSTVAYAVDIPQLINNLADSFERQTGMRVSGAARREFIIPALPHKDHVERELSNGKINFPFLEDSIRTLLVNAEDIARAAGKSEIDADSALASMQRYCPYLFWC